MKRVPFTRREHAAAAATAALEAVRSGGVVLVPTETFYGLAADPRSEGGVTRVYELKGRPAERALPVLCADWAQVEALVEVPEAFRVRLSRTWPGALTVVLPIRRTLPAAAGTTLAVRIPAHSLLRALLYRTGPLTGTSANRHQAPPSTLPDAALEGLVGEPDLVLEGGATPGGVASTLVDLSGPAPVVLRPGAAPWS